MAYKAPPRPPKRPPHPPVQTYDPNAVLPVTSGLATQVVNGVKYKVYYETDWHQVMTDDGVPLCELIKSFPVMDSNGFYQYKGVLRNKPGVSGSDQLFAMTSQKIGDVYLVETNFIVDQKYVCDVYTWLGPDGGWVFQGSTQRKSFVEEGVSPITRVLPEVLGDPGQILIVSEDGQSIVWGDPIVDDPGSGTDPVPTPDVTEEITEAINTHDADTSAHADIRSELDSLREAVETGSGTVDTEAITDAVIEAVNETLQTTVANDVSDHDSNPNAHEDLRRMLEELQANPPSAPTKIKVFTDTIQSGNWTYNGSNGYYEYIYQNDKIGPNMYFEITPVITEKSLERALSTAKIVPAFQIVWNEGANAYAVLKAQHVPAANFDVSVKVLGAGEEV